MTKEEKLACFTNELASITDVKLREFVETILNETGDWFYHDAASTSGRYHPKFALGDGGLVRHTRAVVYWVKELSRSEMFNVNTHQTDLLIAAAIMHDIRKHTATGGYIAKHARAAYDLVVETQTKLPDLVSADDVKYIADAISTHMGIWGVRDGERKPTSDSEKLLHIADLMASRKESILEIFEPTAQAELPKIQSLDIVSAPKPNIIVETKEAVPDVETDVNSDIGGYVITFGRKYPNKSLDEIFAVDRDYLAWIANKEDFFNKECQEKVKIFLKSKQ